MLKFEKCKRAILGPSSSHFIANLEKKFGKTFAWVSMGFLKKKASQKSEILIKTG